MSGRLQRLLPAVSYLRVYQPLHAFGDEDQLKIKAQRLDRNQVEEAEAEQIMQRLLTADKDPFPQHTDELFRPITFPAEELDATDYFSPNSFVALSYLTVEELAEELDDDLFTEFIPEDARLRNLENFGHDTEAAHLAAADAVHCRFALATVPMAWFVPFRRTDHVSLVEDGEKVVGQRIYVALYDARERVKKACATLALHAPDLPLLEELMDLSQWFEKFNHDSVLELDYGRLAAFVYPDDSVDDIQTGLDSLKEGDMTAVAAAHRRMSLRWGPAQFLPRLN